LYRDQARVAGYDTDPQEAPFALRFPTAAHVADLRSIQGQMAVFDHMLDHGGCDFVIDVWSRSFLPFFEVARSVSFFREAEARGLAPCIVYHADASDLARETARELAALWPGVDLLIVHNAGAAELGDDVPAVLKNYPGQRALHVPALDPFLRRLIDEPGFSLSGFLRAPPENMSLVVRAALHAWLSRVFDQITSYELMIALRDADFMR
jgi:NAD(P)-dependent dehydrogenase (short-subunit alcohol dehydrogenase family)